MPSWTNPSVYHELEVRHGTPFATHLRPTGVDQDPVGPTLEPVRLTEPRELSPDRDDGLLGGVLGEVAVPEDALREIEPPVAQRQREGREGILIALLRSYHQVTLHAFRLAAGL